MQRLLLLAVTDLTHGLGLLTVNGADAIEANGMTGFDGVADIVAVDALLVAAGTYLQS